MSELRRRSVQGLKAGDSFEVRRTFTEHETLAFGALTRDYNPVHYEPRYARDKGFPGIICHGLLTGAMLCELGGQMGWLATGMSFRFRRPVLPGDTVLCRLVLEEVLAGGKARATASYTNQRGELVATAELFGYLPCDAARDTLASMVAEGDPTNPLRDR